MRNLATPTYGRLAAGGVIALAAAGCLSGEDIDLGRNLDASARSTPTSEGGPSPGLDQSLRAMIEAPMGTVCAGGCVPLSGWATGGGGSYTYTWGQDAGEGQGPIEVCPATTTTYDLAVASPTSDVMATASLTITVIACDGGEPNPMVDAGDPQATAPPDAATTPVCISNPSFEGPVATGPVGPSGLPQTTTPQGWEACSGTPSVDPTVSPLPALNGKSYIGLPVGTGTFTDSTSSLGTALCSTLQPGVEYSFCINLGVAFTGAAVPQTPLAPSLEIWGGTGPCDKAEKLWTSPAITLANSWMNNCANFFPLYPDTNIVLVPTETTVTGTSSLSYVIVDNIVGP
jgi:hypothetical protein